MPRSTSAEQSQLFNDNPRGKPRLRTLGYGTRKKAKNSIAQLKKMPANYQRQAATTMYYRAKYHKYRTADMEEAMEEYGKFLRRISRRHTGGQGAFSVRYPELGVVDGQNWTTNLGSAALATAPTFTVPHNASSYLLIMTDPNAPSGCFVHWIAEIQGSNIVNRIPYYPPSPPSGTGTHNYIFTLYLLDNGSQRHCLSTSFYIVA